MKHEGMVWESILNGLSIYRCLSIWRTIVLSQGAQNNTYWYVYIEAQGVQFHPLPYQQWFLIGRQLIDGYLGRYFKRLRKSWDEIQVSAPIMIGERDGKWGGVWEAFKKILPPSIRVSSIFVTGCILSSKVHFVIKKHFVCYNTFTS